MKERRMTEAEGDLLQEITNQYWRDFSELINSTLLLVPTHLRNLLEEKLQESSSVYGREDVHTYEKDAPHPYTLTRGPCRVCTKQFDASLHQETVSSI
jgi:hypothetical protein